MRSGISHLQIVKRSLSAFKAGALGEVPQLHLVVLSLAGFVAGAMLYSLLSRYW
jgi:hypothetical protein